MVLQQLDARQRAQQAEHLYGLKEHHCQEAQRIELEDLLWRWQLLERSCLLRHRDYRRPDCSWPGRRGSI